MVVFPASQLVMLVFQGVFVNSLIPRGEFSPSKTTVASGKSRAKSIFSGLGTCDVKASNDESTFLSVQIHKGLRDGLFSGVNTPETNMTLENPPFCIEDTSSNAWCSIVMLVFMDCNLGIQKAEVWFR